MVSFFQDVLINLCVFIGDSLTHFPTTKSGTFGVPGGVRTGRGTADPKSGHPGKNGTSGNPTVSMPVISQNVDGQSDSVICIVLLTSECVLNKSCKKLYLFSYFMLREQLTMPNKASISQQILLNGGVNNL